MANNQTPKLKAFVRIDGSGRVIPGAPIFQASKPKVGTWREIPLYYRGDGRTTTSTTTSAPQLRISETECGQLVPYREITIVNGTSICDGMIYITGDFTGLPSTFYVNYGSSSRGFASMGNQAYPMGPCSTCGGTTTSTSTSTTTSTTTLPPLDYSYLDYGNDEAVACSNSGGNIYGGIAQGQTLNDVSKIYANFAGSGFSQGTVLYFRGVFAGVYTKQFTVDAGGQSATATGPTTYCP